MMWSMTSLCSRLVIGKHPFRRRAVVRFYRAAAGGHYQDDDDDDGDMSFGEHLDLDGVFSDPNPDPDPDPEHSSTSSPKFTIDDVITATSSKAHAFGTPLRITKPIGKLAPLEGHKLERKLRMLERETQTETKHVMRHQWRSLLRKACASRSNHAITTVFERMRQAHSVSQAQAHTDTGAYNMVLAAHARDGRIQEARALFDVIPARTKRPHSFASYFLLMDALVPSHKLECSEIIARTSELWRVYNRMRLDGVRPTSQCLAELLILFSEQRRSSSRLSSLLRCFHQMGAEVSSSTVSALLAKLRPDLPRHLKDNIPEASPASLLAEHARRRRPNHTKLALEALPDPDPISVGRALHCFARCGRWKLVWSTIESTCTAENPLTIGTLSALLVWAAKQSRWNHVQRLLELASSTQTRLRDISLTSAINEAARRGKVDMLAPLSAQLDELDDVVLTVLARSGSYHECREIVRRAHKPDLVLCTIVLASATTIPQVQEAWRLLLEMGFSVDGKALSTLKRACTLLESNEVLFELVSEAADHMLSKGEAWPSLLELMLEISVREQGFQRSWAALGLFVRAGLQPRSPVLSTLFRALGFQECLEWIVESNLALGIWEHNLLLRLMALTNDGGDVHYAFVRMKEHGLMPNAHSYNSLLIAASRRLDLQKTYAILEQMQRAGFAPNATTFTALVFLASRLSDYRSAANMLEVMKRHHMALSYTAAVSVATQLGAHLLEGVRLLKNRSANHQTHSNSDEHHFFDL